MSNEEKLIEIDGRLVGLIGLERLFEELSSSDMSDPEAIKGELIERVAQENYIPPGRQESYREAIFREFTRYLLEPSEDEKLPRMTWHGVPREVIQWYPIVDETECDGCKKCITFCSFGVFSYSREEETVKVSDPFACVVGCSLCATICKLGVISFPPLSYLDSFRK